MIQAASPLHSTRTILLADDNEVLRMGMRKALTRLGFRVVEAEIRASRDLGLGRVLRLRRRRKRPSRVSCRRNPTRRRRRPAPSSG